MSGFVLRNVAVVGISALVFGCAMNPKNEIIYSQSEEMSLPSSELKSAEAKAHAGDLVAMGLVYNHYTYGQYDAEKSSYWLKRLAKSGHAPSQFNYGKTLIDEGQKQAGMKLVRMSAGQGYQPAKDYLEKKGSPPR